MIHLTPQQLSSYMDGELNEASTELVRRHMGACEECTLKFAALEVQEDLLSRALVHDPGDEFFQKFAADVERQIPAGKDSGGKSSASTIRPSAARSASVSTPTPQAEARPLAARDFNPPEPAPSPVSSFDDADAMGEEMVPVPVARPAPPPRAVERPAPKPKPVQRPKPVRPKVHRPAPSIPWYVAAILAVISASAGVVVSRTEPVSAWLDTVAPGHLAASPREEPVTVPPPSNPADNAAPNHKESAPAAKESGTSAKESAPAAKEGASSTKENAPAAKITLTPVTDDEAIDREMDPEEQSPDSTPDVPEPEPMEASRFLKSDSPAPRAAAGQKDPFGSLPAPVLTQVRSAQRSVTAADNDPSAARYETAAAEWERATPLLSGWLQSLGRFEIASAKYRAWEMSPTQSRAAAANSSIRAYMASAPQGPARDQARSWMARLSR